jgi:hypothetical protein
MPIHVQKVSENKRSLLPTVQSNDEYAADDDEQVTKALTFFDSILDPYLVADEINSKKQSSKYGLFIDCSCE